MVHYTMYMAMKFVVEVKIRMKHLGIDIEKIHISNY